MQIYKTLILAALVAPVMAGCSPALQDVETTFIAAERNLLASTATDILPPQPSDNENPIVIGASIALNGLGQPFDDIPLKGAQIAIGDINAKGGVLGRPLTLIVANNESALELSKIATQELLDRNAEIVLVSCALGYGPTAIDQVQKARKNSFSSCAFHPYFSIADYGRQIFSLMLSPAAQGATMAEWAFREKGWRNAYLVTNYANAYFKEICRNFKDRWQDLGGVVVGEDFYKASPTGVHLDQATRMKATNGAEFAFLCTTAAMPQIIVHKTIVDAFPLVTATTTNGIVTFHFPATWQTKGWSVTTEFGDVFDGVGLVKSIRAAGIDLPLVAPVAMDGDYWLPEVPGLSDFYVGVYGSKFGNDPDPKINDFVRRYTETFGMPPTSSHAMVGYSQVEAWARAAERAGSLDAEAIAAELDKFDREPLLIGPTTFTPEHDVAGDIGMLIMEVQNGKHIPLTRYVAE
jgi:branched-chain amino acid transport system substrate-binding protein